VPFFKDEDWDGGDGGNSSSSTGSSNIISNAINAFISTVNTIVNTIVGAVEAWVTDGTSESTGDNTASPQQSDTTATVSDSSMVADQPNEFESYDGDAQVIVDDETSEIEDSESYDTCPIESEYLMGLSDEETFALDWAMDKFSDVLPGVAASLMMMIWHEPEHLQAAFNVSSSFAGAFDWLLAESNIVDAGASPFRDFVEDELGPIVQMAVDELIAQQEEMYRMYEEQNERESSANQIADNPCTRLFGDEAILVSDLSEGALICDIPHPTLEGRFIVNATPGDNLEETSSMLMEIRERWARGEREYTGPPGLLLLLLLPAVIAFEPLDWVLTGAEITIKAGTGNLTWEDLGWASLGLLPVLSTRMSGLDDMADAAHHSDNVLDDVVDAAHHSDNVLDNIDDVRTITRTNAATVDLAEVTLDQVEEVAVLAAIYDVDIGITGRLADTATEAQIRWDAVDEALRLAEGNDQLADVLDRSILEADNPAEALSGILDTLSPEQMRAWQDTQGVASRQFRDEGIVISPAQVKLSRGADEADIFIPPDQWDALPESAQDEIEDAINDIFRPEGVDPEDFEVDFYQEIRSYKVPDSWYGTWNPTDAPPGMIEVKPDGTIIHNEIGQ
jgi:hypothetical protein